MRAEHQQYLPSPPWRMRFYCSSLQVISQVYFLPKLYPAPNISIWSVFCSLSDESSPLILHLQHRNLELFPLIKISLPAYLTLQPCLIVPAAPLEGLFSLVLRWHTFTTSIFIPINTLNFCLSDQKAAQLIHFFPSYSMKLQSTKLSEKKWNTARPPVVYLILVVCLRVILLRQ